MIKNFEVGKVYTITEAPGNVHPDVPATVLVLKTPLGLGSNMFVVLTDRGKVMEWVLLPGCRRPVE